jgi:hypothetical protein
MVLRPGWMDEDVPPALQAQLTTGVAAMGQSMEAMLAQRAQVTGDRARVMLVVSEMAQAVKASGSGAATRVDAARRALCARQRGGAGSGRGD